MFFFRALYEVCEAHSKHTLSCGVCLDCGTLNTIVLELNRSEILPAVDKIQHYLSACTKVLTGKERIRGGPGLGTSNSCKIVLFSDAMSLIKSEFC